MFVMSIFLKNEKEGNAQLPGDMERMRFSMQHY